MATRRLTTTLACVDGTMEASALHPIPIRLAPSNSATLFSLGFMTRIKSLQCGEKRAPMLVRLATAIDQKRALKFREDMKESMAELFCWSYYFNSSALLLCVSTASAHGRNTGLAAEGLS